MTNIYERAASKASMETNSRDTLADRCARIGAFARDLGFPAIPEPADLR
jgi:hypothetical protein